MSDRHPCAYVLPHELTIPYVRSIQAAVKQCSDAIEGMIGGGNWHGQHVGHYDMQAAHAEIDRATTALYDTIAATCPTAADTTAALRCVRLARGAGHDALLLSERWADGECSRLVRDQLRLARYQACAAVALADPSALPHLPTAG